MSFQIFPRGFSVQNSIPLLSTVPPMMVLVVPCFEVHGSSPALTLKHFFQFKIYLKNLLNSRTMCTHCEISILYFWEGWDLKVCWKSEASRKILNFTCRNLIQSLYLSLVQIIFFDVLILWLHIHCSLQESCSIIVR